MNPSFFSTPNSLGKKFLRRPGTCVILAVLAVLYFGALFAPFLAPYNTSSQVLEHAYHPPTPILIQGGKLGIRRYELVDAASRKFVPVPNSFIKIEFFAAGEPYRLFGLIPMRVRLFTVQEGERIYLLGADHFGRDVFSRLLYGSQVSLSVGLLGIAITSSIGLLLGSLAGYLGGAADQLLMRLSEILMSVPSLYLILALRATFGEGLNSAQTYVMIVVILSFIGWCGMSRVIRGMVLSLRERDYVTAARAMGVPMWQILLRHILPNTISYVIVAATLSVPGYILGEAALSFLGLGITEPDSSWGLMLSQAQSIRVLTGYWWMLTPGVMIILTVMAFNFLGDALRDAIDPRFQPFSLQKK